MVCGAPARHWRNNQRDLATRIPTKDMRVKFSFNNIEQIVLRLGLLALMIIELCKLIFKTFNN
jgi:hypothetical protein